MSLRGRQLFVGNIPFSAGWTELKDLFRGAGVVLRANVMQTRDGRSKGHGIVLFQTLEDAKKAEEMFNGYEWHGRPLEVREDRSIVDFPRKHVPTQQEDVDNLADALDQKLAVNTDNEEPLESTDQPEDSNKSNGDAAAVKEGTSETGAIKPIQGRTIHVGNIPFRARWQDLKDLFRKAGHVVRADVAIGPENRSRGFGTVIFSNEEEANRAIAMFDQYLWQDRVLQVQEDRSGQENGRHHEGAPNHGMGHVPGHFQPGPYFRNPPPINPNFAAGRQVFVGNLPFQCQWQDLKDLFRRAGNIIRADVAHGYDGRSRGFGSVLFGTPEDARNAIAAFDNYEYNGRILRVHYDRLTPMGHGLPMHGNMGPMMHPHPQHHPHPHPHGHPNHPPHHPHHHPHRLHPMHVQHNLGFHGNFHQPPMMPLGNLPMAHGGTPPPPLPGQFNMGPPPPSTFGDRNFSPSLIGPGSNPPPEFSPAEGSVDASPHSVDLPGLVNANDLDSAPSPAFDSTSTPTLGASSPIVSSAASASGVFSSSAGLPPLGPPPPHVFGRPGSPSLQHYPFLGHLGPIGKPGLGHSHLNEHTGAGAVPAGLLPISVAGAEGDEDFVTGNPYHFNHSNGSTDNENSQEETPVGALGHDFGHDERQDEHTDSNNNNNVKNTLDSSNAFSQHFYMHQGLAQNLQNRHQQGFQQHQQPLLPPPGYAPYQDQYSQEQQQHQHHLVHANTGAIGSLGGNTLGHGHGLGHGYPGQPEWMAHPNTFMMGPPPHQHMYGTIPFGQYGGHTGDVGLDGDEGEGEGDQQQLPHQHLHLHQHQHRTDKDLEYTETAHFELH
ncbi:hypothetical protein BG011_003843 [Mortierella polycephala]|uniref:RRM domain-containing protein n=1 Tax=Mortierella polycephala TaxID=41804 RepID=A0A9P6Q249_9FUNG|nr:hypothetical protein BG011_003843 [Mortierella polycephala]